MTHKSYANNNRTKQHVIEYNKMIRYYQKEKNNK